MSEEQAKNDMSMWLSTYGLITAERVLGCYKISLQHDQLPNAIKNTHTFYYRLLHGPLKNIFNGIILQQAREYQIYAQKLFIDYLMSGESSKDEETPGGFTREDLENERKALVEKGEGFRECELAHDKLIADTQKELIPYADSWKENMGSAAKNIQAVLQTQRIDKDEKSISLALNACITSQGTNPKQVDWSRIEQILGRSLSSDLKDQFISGARQLNDFTAGMDASLANLTGQISDMENQLRRWRTDFYNLILRVHALIKLLPEYQSDQTQDEAHRESLYFDSEIGEE